MTRTQRWIVVSVVGVGVFALTWWAAESVFGFDRGTAQAFAGLAVALVTVPAGWWYGLDPVPRRVPAADPTQPETVTVAKPRNPLVVGVIVVVVLTACLGLFQTVRPRTNTGLDGGSPTGDSTPGQAQQVNTSQTVWYAGLKVTVGQVTFTPDGFDSQVVAKVRLDNQSSKPFDPYFFNASLKVGTQFTDGGLVEENDVPALTASDYRLSFRISDVGQLRDDAIVFGRGSEVQSIVPLGAGGGYLVANAPRPAIAAQKLTYPDLVITLHGCALQGDFVQPNKQADKGYYVLGCDLDVQYTGPDYTYVRSDDIRLSLPNGTAISATYLPNDYYPDNQVYAHNYLGFTFAWPAPGQYTLKLLTRQLSFTVDNP